MRINRKNRLSLSKLVTAIVAITVFFSTAICVFFSLMYYKNAVEQNAITNSMQAVGQVSSMLTSYTKDMNDIMNAIRSTVEKEDKKLQYEYFTEMTQMRRDLETIMVYGEDGELLDYWAKGRVLKDKMSTNLSYEALPKKEGIHISAPHVQNMFLNDYLWVVTISEQIKTKSGEWHQICMDIHFANIASYVDGVGIGAHGYCFIMDDAGNIVYHPQQQLLYAKLKKERTDEIGKYSDGTHIADGVIYTVLTLDNCNWKIIGVSYVDEVVTSKVSNMAYIVLFIIGIVVFATTVAGMFFSRLLSKPAQELTEAMQKFEKEGEAFSFYPIDGTYEITSLSDSFGHMVVRIQELMEKVRQEEVTLRKTELNALQAQINPHFLYNTLDSISWMCEEGRTEEAVEMVNALARLFRISISKGHEMIKIERELQHAEAYLRIQKFRYKNKFTYSFRVDEKCRDYLCNKISLQPLIENAIYHGLDMSDDGEITIEVYEEQGNIVMAVIDDGVGMTEEECKRILNTDVDSPSGIGLKNVNDRVKIYFGPNYGLVIKSELDEGTRVEIHMPKVMEDNYEK
ncbi:MAG: sensor histidine kinase [Lachnospiraceae bacterium]|nr:sensor histidine kinase [Lachnospiraceae bacterium]